MKKILFGFASAVACMVIGFPASAQFFDYTSTFSPSPVLTNVAGSMYTVTSNENLSGILAGALGTDILPTNFVAVATSATTATFIGPVTETITLVPTNSSGVALAGDTAVSHTFTPDLDIEDLNTNQTDSLMTNIGAGSPTLVYSFADGSVFDVQLTSYTGPGAPSGSGVGSLQAHVTGSLAGVPQQTPEPGSLALFVGIGVISSACLRRRRLA